LIPARQRYLLVDEVRRNPVAARRENPPASDPLSFGPRREVRAAVIRGRERGLRARPARQPGVLVDSVTAGGLLESRVTNQIDVEWRRRRGCGSRSRDHRCHQNSGKNRDLQRSKRADGHS